MMNSAEVYTLAKECLTANGCDELNADAVATTIKQAESDGCSSHGLFRIPGYVAALRSGKCNGKSRPHATAVSPAVIRLHGDSGFTPVALKIGIPLLSEAAKNTGVAILAITHTHHFAALWHETEALAENGLAALACTAYMPCVAPIGAKKPLFGTNPISFAWPRLKKTPLVFDMATAARARGDLQIAKRDGHTVPLGTGLDADGNDTTDPEKILSGGVQLPFGGYKGSAIAMMVELLSAALIGERFSFEAAELDNKDGGPPQGGEFLLAMNPEIIAGAGWQEHGESFITRLAAMEGVRLSGQRRHTNRLAKSPCAINAELVDKIKHLIG